VRLHKRTACIVLRRTWQCGDELTIKFHVFTRHQRGEGLKTRASKADLKIWRYGKSELTSQVLSLGKWSKN